jgi:hypothetical protein
MKVSAPTMIERLALYATDAELRAAIFGARAKDPVCGGMYDRLSKLPTFPKLRLAMGGRHVPSSPSNFDSKLPERLRSIGPSCKHARGVLPRLRTGNASHDARDEELIQRKSRRPLLAARSLGEMAQRAKRQVAVVAHGRRTLLAPLGRKCGSGSGCDARRLSTDRSIRT